MPIEPAILVTPNSDTGIRAAPSPQIEIPGHATDNNDSIKLRKLAIDTKQERAENSYGYHLNLVADALAAVLMMGSDEVVPDRTFLEHGLDSIGGVEMSRRLSEDTALKIDAMDLYNYVSPEKLAAWLSSRVTSTSIDTTKVRANAATSPGVGIQLRALSSNTSQPDAEPTTHERSSYRSSSKKEGEGAVSEQVRTHTDHFDIRDVIADSVRAVLQMGDESVPHDVPLASLGLDSLGAVELAKALEQKFQVRVDATTLYDFPTIERLEQFFKAKSLTDKLLSQTEERSNESVVGAHGTHSLALPALATETKNIANPKQSIVGESHFTPIDPHATKDQRIAIVGMAGRFPGANDVDKFWENLLAGVDAVGEIPHSRWDWRASFDTDPEVRGKSYSRWGGFLDQIDEFDADFFGISPLEAESMDPQQRVILETSWHALEDASIVPSSLKGHRCAIYLGAATSDYEKLVADAGLEQEAEAFTGLSASILAARLAYILDLQGPAVAIETACSSSLVAVHEAIQALLTTDCELALAGGVMTMSTPRLHVRAGKAGMLSRTGRCRSFSDAADGIVLAEGVGVVILKRLSDAINDGDPIRAVIHGSGVNQDGRTNGITAPSARSQAELIRAVQQASKVSADKIGLLETHGTGTELGDPIEFKALMDVFAGAGTHHRPVFLSSAKSAIGHATVAAGVAGLISAVKAVETGEVGPMLHFERPNERVSLQGSPFVVPLGRSEWGNKDEHRYAAVSSFGFSGTNAHVIISQAPKSVRKQQPNVEMPLPIVVSGKNEEAFLRNCKALRDWLHGAGQSCNLYDLAFTLACGRERFAVGGVFFTSNISELSQHLLAPAPGMRGTVPESWREQTENWLIGKYNGLQERIRKFGGRWCSAPKYVFEPSQYWVAPAKTTEADALSLNGQSARRPQAPVARRYENTIRETDEVLADHVVSGKPVLPGTATLSLAVRAAFESGHSFPIEVQNVAWSEACVLEEGEKEKRIQTELLMQNDVLGFSVFESSEQRFASGDIVVEPSVHQKSFTVLAPPSTSRANVDKTELYESLQNRGLEHRGKYCRVEQVRLVNDVEAWVDLISSKPSSAAEVDPIILDAILHGSAALLPLSGPNANLYLPVGIERLTFFGPLHHVRKVRVVRLKTSAGGSTTTEEHFDITGYDEYGSVVVDAARFSLKPVRAWKLDANSNDLYVYQPKWVSRVIKASPNGADCFSYTTSAVRDDSEKDWDAFLKSDLPRQSHALISLRGMSALELFGRLRTLALSLAGYESAPIVTISVESESEGRATAGFLQSLRHENPELRLRVVWANAEVKSEELKKLASIPFDGELFWRIDRGGNTAFHRYVPTEKTEMAQDYEGIWLITGGTGAIGRHLARHITEQGGKPILLGRGSAHGLSSTATSLPLDISDSASVRHAMKEVREKHGPIRGIMHLANARADGWLGSVSESSAAAVVNVKVMGLQNLLSAVDKDELRTVVVFSSVASVQGHPGQAAYAFANGWLDGHEAETGIVYKSIVWPWWRDGGIPIDPDMLSVLERRTGIAPVDTQAALLACDHALTHPARHLILAPGIKPQIDEWLASNLRPFNSQNSTNTVRGGVEQHLPLVDRLRAVLIDVLKLNPERVKDDKPFAEYGLESITLTRYANRLNRVLGIDLSPALLFEADTLTKLSQRIEQDFGTHLGGMQSLEEEQSIAAESSKNEQTHALNVVDIQGRREPIAIVGMAARLPGSPDLDAFWHHLVDKKDLVTEVPRDRWDWQELYGEDVPLGERTRSRWGGFIENVAHFDANFFGISPREAELLDPQQRLFLQTTWGAIENAGIAPSSLAGSDTGLFVGVATSDYLDLTLRAGSPIEAHTATGMSHSMLPNRISYLLDLRGPSEPVDTACSSSLVALARAVNAIRRGDCRIAIAGGTNVILSPTLYIAFDRAGMLSPRGRCRVFDADADGYVRGEGVGAVVLKKLSSALSDGDPIWGVIRDISVAHGGRASSLTAPNPNAQADLIKRVIRNSGVSVEDIGYIEAHGTGTPLGDPVELVGLTQAFRELGWQGSANSVRVGALKANVGHLEASAGVAGLIKVLLALRHKTIPGQALFRTLNPHIRLDNTPFRIATNSEPWNVENGSRRRVAGLSSFGFGGANAHVVIEEAPPSDDTPGQTQSQPYPIVLSAKTKTALKEMAKTLYAYLTKRNLPFDSVVWTLQSGRDHMHHRIGFMSASNAETLQGLKSFFDGDEEEVGYAEVDLDANASSLVPNSASQMLSAWLRGGSVPWEKLWPTLPKRCSLPGTFFEEKRFWSAAAQPFQRPVVTPGMEADQQKQRISDEPVHAGPYEEDITFEPKWEREPHHIPEKIWKRSSAAWILSRGRVPPDFMDSLSRRFEKPIYSVDLDSIGELPHLIDKTVEDIYFFDVDWTKEVRQPTDGFKPTNAAHQLLRVIQHHATSKELKLSILTSGVTDAGDSIPFRPSSAGMIGVARTAQNEFPNWTVRIADLLEPNLSPETVLSRLESPECATLCAFDSSGYWKQVLSTTKSIPVEAPPFEKAVTLIIGGTSGIIQSVAPRLAEKISGVYIFTGRRPQNEAMDTLLSEMRARGSEAIFWQLDPSSGLAVETMIKRIASEWGRIDYVIDSVLDLDNDSIVNLRGERFTKVFASRVTIAANIEAALLATRQSPVWLAMSSVQSFLGNRGQANYAAACNAMDAWMLGSELSARVINWGYWGSVGAVASTSYRETMRKNGIGSIEPPEGSAAIESMLIDGNRQRVIARGTAGALNRIGVRGPAADTSETLVGIRELDKQIPALVTTAIRALPSSTLLSNEHVVPLKRALLQMTQTSQPLSGTCGEALDAFVRQYPKTSAHIDLLRLALAGLPELLVGRADGTEILLPGGSFDRIAAIYKGNALADEVNRLVHTEVLAESRKRKIKIIEVGAGTGGTTVGLIEALKNANVDYEYDYTDVSEAFVAYGRRTFENTNQSMSFRTLDIERDVIAQGLETETYDIVVCANVLHATRNIKEVIRRVRGLLRPGGKLILSELTQVLNFNTVTFGLLDGWWRFDDVDLRLPHSPLLSPDSWRTLLRQNRFVDVELVDAGLGLMMVRACLLSVMEQTSTTENELRESAHNEVRIRTVVLQTLATVLRLDADEISTRVSFSELGVDSILAAEVVKRLSDELSVSVKPTEIFNHPTVDQLVSYLCTLVGHFMNEESATLVSENFEDFPSSQIEEQQDDDLIRILERLECGQLNLEQATDALEASRD
jgi:acyl transferase domain-containing protein/acyl carrier protein/NAD(P)-dependent dehydrogenase (short-subunit alcohol dehydrogenase family)/ubiquinone/menaquinone biosynthesis C-methylase UbiE